MNMINSVLDNWSKYEINMEIFLILGIFLLTVASIYLSTKNRKILILSCISFVLVLILNSLGIFILTSIFKMHISEIFRLIPIISLILTVSNLGILVGFYISKKDAKGFKIGSIRKEYFSDSIKQSIFLMLLGASTLLFLSPQTEAIVSVSILSTVLTVWVTYWVSKYILR